VPPTTSSGGHPGLPAPPAFVGSGSGEVMDAPHTGALVRFDNANWSGFAGATRPEG